MGLEKSDAMCGLLCSFGRVVKEFAEWDAAVLPFLPLWDAFDDGARAICM